MGSIIETKLRKKEEILNDLMEKNEKNDHR